MVCFKCGTAGHKASDCKAGVKRNAQGAAKGRW